MMMMMRVERSDGNKKFNTFLEGGNEMHVVCLQFLLPSSNGIVDNGAVDWYLAWHIRTKCCLKKASYPNE